MSQWSDYYKSRVGTSYAMYAEERYQPMIDELLAGSGSFREEGCGIGTITKILNMNRPGINVIAFDNDPAMLRLARRNLKRFGTLLYNNDILAGFDLPVETIFSHGVLEHFTDRDILKILIRQRFLANKVVHYVPTDGYDNPSFGDERLMSINWWLDTWSPTRYEVFNDRKDLMMVWERS